MHTLTHSSEKCFENVHQHYSQLKVYFAFCKQCFVHMANCIMSTFTTQSTHPHLMSTLYIDCLVQDEATWIHDSHFLLLGIGVY